jgi:uncharacterized protein YuzE
MKFRSAKKQNIHYDQHSDVLYFGARKGIEEEFIEIAPGMVAELDKEKNIIGIEILNASKFFKSVLKPIQKQILTIASR